MSDLIDNKALWGVLRSVDRLLSCADTESEVLSVEKKLHFEIRCIAAAIHKEKVIEHIKRD